MCLKKKQGGKCLFHVKSKGVKSKSGIWAVQVGLGAECKRGAGLVQFMMFTLPLWQERGKVHSS